MIDTVRTLIDAILVMVLIAWAISKLDALFNALTTRLTYGKLPMPKHLQETGE